MHKINLANHRSSLVFSTGLICAAALAIGMDGGIRYLVLSGASKLDYSQEEAFAPAVPRSLSDTDWEAAKTAWAFISENTQAETGLVDSVSGFPSTTLWDQGSYLLGLVSAERLGLLGAAEYHDRVRRLLASFERMPLFEGLLPNKVYHTRTLQMVDYENVAQPEGIGWSALDVARMLTAFRVLERRSPEYGTRIRDLLGRWSLDAMVSNGELIGTTRQNGDTEYLQEGRIGYEQYAARAAAMWGLDVIQAISAERILSWQAASGIDVPADLRDHSVFHAITPTLSEPYFLQGLEFGFDSESRRLASRVYEAQVQRYRNTGQFTAVSEDHLDQAPHFAYSSVYSNGDAWAVVSETGERFDELRTVSLKAGYAWHALFDTDYTQSLVNELSVLADPEQGWAAGIYEADRSQNSVYTLNTNAIVLEALHFMAHGPLWQVRS